MIIGILKDSGTENRVALLPGEVSILKKLGIEVIIEHHAGEGAFATDKAYLAAGASAADRNGVTLRLVTILNLSGRGR
jgi:NAD(P) transhydrogenase subunit alpha